MKQVIAVVVLVLSVAGMGSAQAQSAGSPKGAAPQLGTQAQPPAQPAVKGIKPPPQAKTQEEYTAFSSALGTAQGGELAAGEAAAREYQSKFPQSELTSQLYLILLFKGLQANNGDKAIEMGREVLKLDPNNPVAALYVSTVLAETARETDLDAAQRFDEAIKDANIALQNVDTNLLMAASVTQQQVDATKADLKARAYDALGLVELKRKNDAAAEKYLRQSIETRGEPGDPMTHLRLALTLDHANRYPEALTEAGKAVSLAPADAAVGKSAQAEVDRLKKLTGSTGAAATGTAAPSQPAPTPTGAPVPR